MPWMMVAVGAHLDVPWLVASAELRHWSKVSAQSEGSTLIEHKPGPWRLGRNRSPSRL